MAAALGGRGRAYVGMGQACDAAAGGGYREAIAQTVQHQQQQLGLLADLLNRAYRGRVSEELIGHKHAQMSTLRRLNNSAPKWLYKQTKNSASAPPTS